MKLIVDNDSFVISQHAKRRMWERKISSSIIREVIRKGKVVDSLKTVKIVLGKYAVILDYKKHVAVIITVMLCNVGGYHG